MVANHFKVRVSFIWTWNDFTWLCWKLYYVRLSNGIIRILFIYIWSRTYTSTWSRWHADELVVSASTTVVTIPYFICPPLRFVCHICHMKSTIVLKDNKTQKYNRLCLTLNKLVYLLVCIGSCWPKATEPARRWGVPKRTMPSAGLFFLPNYGATHVSEVRCPMLSWLS